MAGQSPNMEQFEAYFQRADADRDGRVTGNEAVAFFQATNLPKQVLAQIWNYADQNRTGFLGRPEFYNALKLVTVAQSKRDLTPEIVKAALYGPASAKIPPPKINLLAAPVSQLDANASPAQVSGSSTSEQNIRASGPHGFPSQQSQIVRPPQPPPPSQVMTVTGSLSVPQAPNRHTGSQGGVSSQAPSRSLSPASQGGFDPLVSTITQPKSLQAAVSSQSASVKPNDIVSFGSQIGKEESKSTSAKGNGFTSDSVFGDVFSATPSVPKQNSGAQAYSAGSLPASSSVTPTSAKDQHTFKPNVVSQSPSIQAQQFQSTGKPNQNVLGQNSAVFSVADGNVASAQSQHPWPRMTQSDIQKYSKVFVQVDADKDGKITGEQARNLFLSWRLPREVLKQVWDLSDQDNDSSLSLREFCIALYLMERYREGRPLPAVLPNSIIFDGVSLPAFGQPVAGYGNTPWRPPSGPVQHQGTKNARSVTSVGGGRPPRPVPVPQPDEPSQHKAKVPVLEKYLVDQLSSEEQDSLNKKFEEAKTAEKKVADLEKDISEAKQKIQFYHAKMQELILYKSRCDNRLNEITEKVVADKREVESLAKKYEEKYKQVGDVASKLTIEEATFRDIQEKKMELYRAIVKLEQDDSDNVQDQANKIQSDLEELVKALNERCKTYGLRGKPTSLVELPFGWQPGISGAASDWDETWDKFEDEGFSYVKELTLDVQNVTAPPKPKSSLIRERTTHLDNGNIVSPPSEVDEKSEVSKKLTDNERPDDLSTEQTARSPPDSPAGGDSVESQPKELRPVRTKDITVNGSAHAFDIKSDHVGTESIPPVVKGFDEPGWGSFDTHYDRDAAWDLNLSTPKDAEKERHSESFLFDGNDWGLNPIKTGSEGIDASFSKQGPFFDSVPSTPAYNDASSETKMGPFFDSVPSTPMYNSVASEPKMSAFFDSVPSTPLYSSSGSPNANSTFMRSSLFADSIPSTPMYNSTTSPRRFNEGSEEQYSFDSFSRFDSFNLHDSGRFSSRESLTRFDSMRSTRDSDDQGYFGRQESLARFDSFRSTADSDYNFGGPFPPQSSFTRFDSTHSTRESDYGHSFSSFDDAADPFGSGEPFRTSHEGQTPRRDSDGWKAF